VKGGGYGENGTIDGQVDAWCSSHLKCRMATVLCIVYGDNW